MDQDNHVDQDGQVDITREEPEGQKPLFDPAKPPESEEELPTGSEEMVLAQSPAEVEASRINLKR